MFITIINIIIIFGKLHARACVWLQDDTRQFYFGIFSKPIFSDAKSLSMLRVQVVQAFPLVSVIRLQVSSLPPAELSDDTPMGSSGNMTE